MNHLVIKPVIPPVNHQKEARTDRIEREDNLRGIKARSQSGLVCSASCLKTNK